MHPGSGLPELVGRAHARTTFWLAPGTYTLGTGAFDQIQPKGHDTFIGAPGAVIDGQHKNLYAFTRGASHVTIEYLTIRNFGAPGDNESQGVVNHDSASHWTVRHDTITANAGAGVMIGSHDVISEDCLSDNGQYGFNGYSSTGPVDVTLEHSEIVGNNTDNWEKRQPGCGCTGGGKFWETNGATVIDNYIHGNHGAGLWADTNNRGFTISGNVIADNADEGLIYEISYNASITHNTFIRNGLVKGPTNPGFPTGAIYVSESGADSRVAGPYGKSLTISHNDFLDNWSGVVLWENADRFCASPNNSSTGVCTLVAPAIANLASCSPANIAHQPYYGDCRWKTQNVMVSDNHFTIDPRAVASNCSAATGCGYNGMFSNYGTSPPWSPYRGEVVEKAITTSQNNHFVDNSYSGPWHFMYHDQGTVYSLTQWKRHRQD